MRQKKFSTKSALVEMGHNWGIRSPRKVVALHRGDPCPPSRRQLPCKLRALGIRPVNFRIAIPERLLVFRCPTPWLISNLFVILTFVIMHWKSRILVYTLKKDCLHEEQFLKRGRLMSISRPAGGSFGSCSTYYYSLHHSEYSGTDVLHFYLLLYVMLELSELEDYLSDSTENVQHSLLFELTGLLQKLVN